MSHRLAVHRVLGKAAFQVGFCSLVLLGLALGGTVHAEDAGVVPGGRAGRGAEGNGVRLFFDVTQAPFGAKADGTHDDTGAIQAAIDACDAQFGGTVSFPPGRYLVDAVVLTRPNLILRGNGQALIVKKHSASKQQDGAQARSAAPVFQDTAGIASGLSCYGLKFDLSRASFKAGNAVSAFFLIRANDLRFVDCEFKNGIEEGLKLYKCQDVIIDRCRFENLSDGGVQIHTPANGGYTGHGPDQGSANVMITRCTFKDIDDGLWGAGNGCGVMMYNGSSNVTTHDVLVQGNTFRGCLTGVWAEAYGQPTRRLMVQDNLVIGQYTAAAPGKPGGQPGQSAHGVGFVGNVQGTITGNTFYNIGTFQAGPSGGAKTSDIAAIIISASGPEMPSRFVRISDNVILDDRGKEAKMAHGLIVRASTDLSLGENQIVGATQAARSIEEPRTEAQH